jgi:regulator of sigma E protease
LTWVIENFQTVLSIVLVFGILIFVHELGHFLLARRAGILAREFAIGFGPKIFSYKKDETRWTIRLFPLGGFVRMAGEDPEVIEIKSGQRLRILTNNENEITHFLLDDLSRPHEGMEVIVSEVDLLHRLSLTAVIGDEEKTFKIHPKAEMISKGMETQIAPWNRQFGSKTVGQRFLTIAAGPVANFLLAVILFIVLAALNGVETNDPVIGNVVKGFPADQAGLKEQDRILSIDGERIDSWEDLQTQINKSPGKSVNMIIERDGEQFQTSIVPQAQIRVSSIAGDHQMDLLPGDIIKQLNGEEIKSLEQAEQILSEHQNDIITVTVPRIKDGKQVEQQMKLNLKEYRIELMQVGIIGISQARDYSIGSILWFGPQETWNWIVRIFDSFGALFSTPDPLNQMGGPVAIFKLTGDAADRGTSTLIFWAALLSINLGIFNLLPIPALDGGRLVFLAVEAIRGKPIDPAKESIVHFIGFAFLMLLIIIVTWNDIQKLFLS